MEISEVPTAFPPQVVLGARPCDAAALAVLDGVMGWDPRDELWFGRREATTVVSVACPGVDSSCFCSALGLGPDSTKGADAILLPLDAAAGPSPSQVAESLEAAVDGFLRESEPYAGASNVPPRHDHWMAASGYLARPVTAKGERLLDGRGSAVADAASVEIGEAFARSARARVEANLARLRTAPDGEQRPGLDRLPEWLARNFDHALWGSLALRCNGCGACAAVCPVDCCIPDPNIPETEEALLERARQLHPDQTFGADFPSRFKKS